MARGFLYHFASQSSLPSLLIGFALGVLMTILFVSLLALQTPSDCQVQVENRISMFECNQRMERLKRLAKIALFRSTIMLNRSCFTDTTPSISPANVTKLRQFLYPSDEEQKEGDRQGVPIGVPQRLNQEYIFRKNLLVGVLTQQAYLHTRAKAVYDTWGRDVDSVVFFVGEDCNISADISYLPIVKLPGIPDNVYPPLRKAFAVMKYMYSHYIHEYNWFIRADDDMYVRGHQLQKLLHSMHPFEKVYMGRAGVGRDQDLDRLRLLPHERYCMGGPGVILSNSAMRGVGPHIDNCLRAVFYHDRNSRHGEWNDDDVEIGRCLSRETEVQCSTSAESRQLFRFDYRGDSLQPLLLWTKHELQELITLHPVKNPDNMQSIHHFYKTLDFENMYEELYNMSSVLNALCKSLPANLSPPLFASSGCDLKLHSVMSTNQSAPSKTAGALISPKKFSSFHNPPNKFDLTYWNTFTSYFVHDGSSASPQHGILPSLKAELTHLLDLVQIYVNGHSPIPIKIEDIIEGHSRFSPSTGREYMLHLKYKEASNPSKPASSMVLRILRPLGPELYVSEVKYTYQTVHIILPLEVVDDRLLQFLLMHRNEVLVSRQRVRLIMVVFGTNNARLAEVITQDTLGSFKTARVTIVTQVGNYSLAKAMEAGVNIVKSADGLMFVADVSLRINSKFYQRCCLNTAIGKSVYYPIPFRMYSSDYSYKRVNSETSVQHFNRWSGYWAVHDFNFLCIHKQDYLNIGGYHESGSSSELFERIAKSTLEVLQMPDPAVTQIWPSKGCNLLLHSGKASYIACQRLKEAALFDQTDLAEYLVGLSRIKNDPIPFVVEDMF